VFKEELSTSFSSTSKVFALKYISGFAKGTIVEDKVLLGNKVVSDVQRFGVVTIFSVCLKLNKDTCTVDYGLCRWDNSEDLCMDKKYPVKQTSNGILGLGFKEGRSNTKMPVVFEGSPLEKFSFYMTGSSAEGSLMIIGEADQALYKEP